MHSPRVGFPSSLARARVFSLPLISRQNLGLIMQSNRQKFTAAGDVARIANKTRNITLLGLSYFSLLSLWLAVNYTDIKKNYTNIIKPIRK